MLGISDYFWWIIIYWRRKTLVHEKYTREATTLMGSEMEAILKMEDYFMKTHSYSVDFLFYMLLLDLSLIMHVAGPKWKPFWTKACSTSSAKQVWLGNWPFWAGLLKLSYDWQGLTLVFFRLVINKLCGGKLCKLF
jgi:hypothetical protein